MKWKICVLYNHPFEKKDSLDRKGVLEQVRIVAKTLNEIKFPYKLLPVGKKGGKWIDFLRKREFDCVINLCEDYNGIPEGEAWIASFLEILEIPYTGSSPSALFLCLNKMRAKDAMLNSGIPTPKYFPLHHLSRGQESLLPFPLILKPLSQDASVGIDSENIVYNEREFKKRVNEIRRKYDFPFFAEEYIEGREFNVSIFDKRVIAIGEVLFSLGQKIVTYKAKWERGSIEDIGTKTEYPALLKDKEKREIEEISMETCRILGVRDYARIDIRMKENGEFFCIDVNPNPDISKGSGFYKALEYAGISYSFFLTKIIEIALERSKK